MARRVDLRKRVEWRQRMGRFRRSGLSVAEFCREEGVSAASFYQWRQKLQQPEDFDVAHARPARTTSAPAAPRPAALAPAAPDFTPVRLVASSCVAVQLPGGTQFEVPTSDPKALQLVVETLAQADAQRGGGAAC